jgi:hypothetical protein
MLLHPGKPPSLSPWIGGWAGPTAFPNIMENRRNRETPRIEPRPSSPYAVLAELSLRLGIPKKRHHLINIGLDGNIILKLMKISFL